MPNQLTAAGLETATQTELVTQLETAFKAIYGNDINLDQDSPDSQMINIFVQVVLDNLDLLKQIYNSFNPDTAIGTVLDQRVTLNGIQRQGGTYSRTNITLVTTQSITIYGKDQSVEPIYTVSDDDGNEWELLVTTSIGAGTHSLLFQSTVPGKVLTTLNTITNPVTIVLGVDSINNPSVQTVIGEDEESDYELRIRRQQSVALASQGYRESLVAALKNITGITDAFVYENNTPATDGDGVPSHSIWVIVSGNYTAADVANAIYKKRNAGCGMHGDIEYTITQLDSSLFVVSWDDVVTVDVFIEVNVESLDGSTNVNYAEIRSQLPTLYIPGVYEKVNINKLASYIQDIDDNCLVTSSGFSLALAGPYTATLLPATKKNQFILSEAKVILLPILITPAAQTVDNLTVIDFEAYGGYGSYTWTLNVNNSGASINASTGVYTAGASSGVDTIRATDGDGNFTDVLITVV